MRNTIGLLILAFMLCGCGKNIDSIDKVVSVSGNDAVGYDSLEDKSSVSNDGISDCDSIEIDKCSYRSNWLDEYLQNGLVVSWHIHEKQLLTLGIDKDSYIYKFIMNEYSVKFDEEAYIEKINEQLPEECVHIYDSDIYLDGTLEDMIKQYSEYLGYPDKIYVHVAFLKNDTCNGARLRFISYSRELNDLYIWLMENEP